MHRVNSKISSLVIIVLLFGMITSSCNYLPLPEEVMRPPIGESNSAIVVDTDRFIPEGMIALNAGNSGGRYHTRFTDIENDGLDELVVFYGVPGEYSGRGLLLLQEYDVWMLYHEVSYTENDRYVLEKADFVDIDGNGRKEIIIELSTFNNARMFQIIKINSQVEKMYMFGADRVDIIRNEDSLPMLAIWQYETNGGFDIDVIRWEEDGFVNASYDVPGYFTKLIPSYEKDENTDSNAFLYLADAFLKSGDYINSLKRINDYLEEDRGNEQKLKAAIIKSRCLFYLGRTDEALAELSSANLVQGYDADLLFEAFILMADILISNGSIEAAKQVLDGSQKLMYNYFESDYKFHLWQHEYDIRFESIKDNT